MYDVVPYNIAWGLHEVLINILAAYFMSTLFKFSISLREIIVSNRRFWHKSIIVISNLRSLDYFYAFPWEFYFWLKIYWLFIVFLHWSDQSFDPECFPRVCYKILCGTHKNLRHIFITPAVLRKFSARVMFGCLHLFTFIDCFYWTVIYLKFVYQELICWFSTCFFSLILSESFDPETSPGCVNKLSVVCIQTVHRDFIPMRA